MPFEPVRIGPVIGSDELVIAVPTRQVVETSLDIIGYLDIFDFMTYSYVIICIYIVVAVMVIIQLKSNDLNADGYDVKSIIMSVAKYCWSICELFVDQEYLSPIRWSDRILWFHYCLACFVTIFGIGVNLMATSKVALSEPLTRCQI